MLYKKIRREYVCDGQQAVQAVRSHQPLYYDMVFMDVQMPVLNGYEAAKAIRASGMDGHLPKPVSIEQLKQALAGCVSWKQQNQTQEQKLSGLDTERNI